AQAETAFRKIVALAPDQALGYANLGLVQLRQGRYDEAEREIRRAAALDTASDDIALTLAKVYELTGRTAQARREVDRVLRRSPGELRALYQLVELDPASRETYLGRIVERAPGNVAARLDLVEVLLARGGGGGGGGRRGARRGARRAPGAARPPRARGGRGGGGGGAGAGGAGGAGRGGGGGGRGGGGGGGGGGDAAAAQLEALERQLPELPREAHRFFEQALTLARAGRAAAAATPAATFHRFMETTAAYQASLQKLRGASGALPGYPILTFNPVITPPAQDARAIAAAIHRSRLPRPLPGSPPARPPRPRCSWTSITTATSTCSWQRPPGTGCTATSATGSSRKWPVRWAWGGAESAGPATPPSVTSTATGTWTWSSWEKTDV